MLKYIVPDYSFPTLYFGVANTIANGLIMLRYIAYWFHHHAHTMLLISTARWCFGFRRTWKTTIPTIWRYEIFEYDNRPVH